MMDRLLNDLRNARPSDTKHRVRKSEADEGKTSYELEGYRVSENGNQRIDSALDLFDAWKGFVQPMSNAFEKTIDRKWFPNVIVDS